MIRAEDKSYFLVRDSGRAAGSYSLSVGTGPKGRSKMFFHYIIKHDHVADKFILDPKPVCFGGVIGYFITTTARH